MNTRLFPRFSRCFLLTLVGLALVACSPKYDWREVHGTGIPFVAMFPAKPSVFSRPVNLDGLTVTMAMTAAEIDGTTFAVGTVELADASQVPAALTAMKTAMVNNIDGKLNSEKTAVGTGRNGGKSINIDASGRRGNGQAMRLLARFVAQGKRIYQVVVLGPEASISHEAGDTFFSAFRPPQ
ncbi:MAG: hypothetical protein V4805_04020 [Pseudomonadota bacterium]